MWQGKFTLGSSCFSSYPLHPPHYTSTLAILLHSIHKSSLWSSSIFKSICPVYTLYLHCFHFAFFFVSELLSLACSSDVLISIFFPFWSLIVKILTSPTLWPSAQPAVFLSHHPKSYITANPQCLTKKTPTKLITYHLGSLQLILTNS